MVEDAVLSERVSEIFPVKQGIYREFFPFWPESAAQGSE
jgi:hypothetical protein